MGQTTIATDNALAKKAWDEKLYRDTKKESYFSKFMGSGSGSLVQVKDRLTKEKGDNITFGIRMRLEGAGVEDGQTLEGNEESLTTYDHDVTLKQYRHAVRDDGAMTRQRAMFSISDESRDALKEWGSEKIDQLCFDAINASPTKIWYGGAASSTATLTATDLITPALISRAKAWAKTGGNRSQTPLRPIMVGGKMYFVLIVHPDVMYDLKQDSTFAQARREALERGKDNPIFTGAEGVWDGVVVHEHENVPITTTWGAGSDVAGAKCSFMGAQSLVLANGKRGSVIHETRDYGNQHAYAWGIITRVNKPVFNNLDYGSMGFYVARTKISDI
ncbi:MAG: N4-gp56 family major capsid protein [Deltaproteobacteria bacterium]|nr:N4-gp56 family major capsid protein [Deltaproteobacteria bacterium]